MKFYFTLVQTFFNRFLEENNERAILLLLNNSDTFGFFIYLKSYFMSRLFVFINHQILNRNNAHKKDFGNYGGGY